MDYGIFRLPDNTTQDVQGGYRLSQQPQLGLGSRLAQGLLNTWNQAKQIANTNSGPVNNYLTDTAQRNFDFYKSLASPQTYAKALRDIKNMPEDWSREFPIDPQTKWLTPEAEAKMKGLAFNLALNWNPAAMAVTAYHGSPYLFDKFRLDKVGTGEGAQAYGHGLYFAENPEVAKFYQPLPIDVVAARNLSPIEDKAFGKGMRTLIDMGGDISKAKVSLANQAKILARKGPSYQSAVDEVNKAMEMMDTGAFKIKQANASLYKVDIPDEAVNKMLDWDKPLSQQPEAVKALLKSGGINPSGRLLSKGSDLLKEIQMDGTLKNAGFPVTDQGASDFLKSLGIPGIKYLDQGSRGAGQGTHNYVVFDENLPKILERK